MRAVRDDVALGPVAARARRRRSRGACAPRRAPPRGGRSPPCRPRRPCGRARRRRGGRARSSRRSKIVPHARSCDHCVPAVEHGARCSSSRAERPGLGGQRVRSTSRGRAGARRRPARGTARASQRVGRLGEAHLAARSAWPARAEERRSGGPPRRTCPSAHRPQHDHEPPARSPAPARRACAAAPPPARGSTSGARCPVGTVSSSPAPSVRSSPSATKLIWPPLDLEVLVAVDRGRARRRARSRPRSTTKSAHDALAAGLLGRLHEHRLLPGERVPDDVAGVHRRGCSQAGWAVRCAAAIRSRTACSSPCRSSSTGSGSPFTIDSKKTLRSW